MKIGIVSDSHDNLDRIRQAVKIFTDREVDAVVHAGDFVAPFAVKEFAKLKVPFYGVFGNNDGEHKGINAVMPQISEPPLQLELDGRKLIVVHDEQQLSEQQKHEANVVICGHTHHHKIERTDDTLIVNPGESGGWLTGESTIGILDLKTLNVELITIASE